MARKRAKLEKRRRNLLERKKELDREVRRQAGPELKEIDRLLAEARRRSSGKKRPEFGYHSAIVAKQDVTKWVQVDLGKTVAVENIEIAGCHDDFNGIGAGFGFPVRYRIELTDDAGPVTIADHTGADPQKQRWHLKELLF